jgi:hypothetical protein
MGGQDCRVSVHVGEVVNDDDAWSEVALRDNAKRAQAEVLEVLNLPGLK